MSKGRTNVMNKKYGIVKKLRKSLLLGKKFSTDDQPENESRGVPEDVKEGHFAVIATDEDELKRFVVPLSCLTHPSFLRLLEQAAEVYGFDHEGALTLPCSPSEMERILAIIVT
ncbi:auxin-induced protein X15-like [Capsicum galapagoense]